MFPTKERTISVTAFHQNGETWPATKHRSRGNQRSQANPQGRLVADGSAANCVRSQPGRLTDFAAESKTVLQ
jgi:hypothetical protein